jgi:hypothetical protein
MIRAVHPGSGSSIFNHPGSRIQGVKKAPDPETGTATLPSGPEKTAAVRCRAPAAGGRGAAPTDRRTDGARRRGSGSEPPSGGLPGSEPPSGLPGSESAPPSEPPAGSNLSLESPGSGPDDGPRW